MSWKQSHCFSFCCHVWGRYTINISHNLFGFSFIDADCKTNNKHCVWVKAWSGEGSCPNIPDVNGKCLIREHNLAITKGDRRNIQGVWKLLVHTDIQYFEWIEMSIFYLNQNKPIIILYWGMTVFHLFKKKNGKGAI